MTFSAYDVWWWPYLFILVAGLRELAQLDLLLRRQQLVAADLAQVLIERSPLFRRTGKCICTEWRATLALLPRVIDLDHGSPLAFPLLPEASDVCTRLCPMQGLCPRTPRCAPRVAL